LSRGASQRRHVEIEFIMARRHVIIDEENLRIPEDAYTFEGFQRWIDSDKFPETGRIDYLEGKVEVDMSPEDLYTHGAVKTAITLKLGYLVVESDLGDVFVDRTRMRSRFADLSVEPDVVVIVWRSLEAGKIRLVPAAARKGPDRFSALEGAVDLVVEIVSDGSVKKDTERLPDLYARAGIPELWIVDARGDDLRFQIRDLQDGSYVTVEPDSEGWVRSPQLGVDFRLVRRRARPAPWRYTLQHRQP
jgi:Uma2 family endonuclease